MTFNSKEISVQRLTDEILLSLGNLADYENAEDRKKYFSEAMDEALAKMTKKEITDVLLFVIEDYEMFFDIFEQCIDRSKNEG
jgi:hypothetical protein